MEFYYEIVFSDGRKLRGQTCDKFKVEDHCLLIIGYDVIPGVYEPEIKSWFSRYRLSEIKEFKVKAMIDD